MNFCQVIFLQMVYFGVILTYFFIYSESWVVNYIYEVTFISDKEELVVISVPFTEINLKK